MKTLLSVLLITTALPCYALSQSDSTLVDDDWEETLGEVVVTATRTPKALKDVPVMTRLITAEEIRRTDATNIQELLQTALPGVEFSYAMNQQVNMNLAGFAGQSVLVLVDGERLAGETMDNVDFARLLMAGVERIEIVKGAASALYGSNAAGGVINIITKEADRKWHANVNTRYGCHGEWRIGGEASAKGKHVSNTLDVNHYSIDTYNVCSDNADACDFRHVYGYRTWNVADKLCYRPMEALTLTARAGYFFKERYYNPDTPDRYRDFSAGLRGQWHIDELNDIELSYAFDQYDKSDYLTDRHLDIRDYRNVINSLRALYNHQFGGGWLLTAGGDIANDFLDTYQFADGEAKRQTTADVFTQFDWTINPHWEIVGALRYDYFSDSKDSRVTSKLNARYRLRRITLRGGYAQGFRAPTLKERYMNFDMAGIFDIHGNASLKPETSQNFSLSAEYALPSDRHGAYSVSLGSNYSFVDNKLSTSAIRYGADGEPYIDYINVESLRVFGLEATANAAWSCGVKAQLAYAYTHEQTIGGSINQYCPARPHSVTANITWHKAWTKRYATDITLNGRYLSSVSYNTMYMYEPFETKHVVNPAYTMWKLQLNQQLCKALQLNATIDNLLNYRPKVYYFNSPITAGTTFSVGLNIDIDKFL